MCFDEWNMNKQITKVLKKLVSLLFNLKEGPTREGAVRDVNRGTIFEEKMCSLAPYTTSGYLIGMMPTYRTTGKEQTARTTAVVRTVHSDYPAR